MDNAVIIGRAAAQQEVQQKAMLRRSNSWQDECAEITRRKALRHRRLSWRRRVTLVLALLVPAYAGLAVWWVQRTDQLPRAVVDMAEWFYARSVEAGFTVKHIAVGGAKQLSAQAVADAAGVKLGDATLQIDLGAVRARLESLPDVREARVRREFPDRIFLSVTEREPSAVWRHDGHTRWVDQDGVVLLHHRQAAGADDLVIRGKDAPEHVKALLALLAQEPALKDKVQAAVRVGQRRWNLMLKNGVAVWLPARDAEAAWRELARLHRESRLLDKAVARIDMRLDDRMFVMPLPDAAAAPVAAEPSTPLAPVSAPEPAEESAHDA